MWVLTSDRIIVNVETLSKICVHRNSVYLFNSSGLVVCRMATTKSEQHAQVVLASIYVGLRAGLSAMDVLDTQ